MGPNFNINRPKISDEEINKHKDFEKLVRQFKERSLKQAQGDESWWKNKKVRYSTVIAGVTVVCTITYLSLFNHNSTQKNKHETLITSAPKKTSPRSFINVPSKHLTIPYTTYKVNNAAGGSFKHHTATKINVPKNSFVDKAGKEIVGDITIEYREFHDAADIIASGIPMTYDSAGRHFNLESAGMFDIRGSYNGEPVFIKPEKNIEVELASSALENRFNQYYLDTLARNWQYMQRDLARPVPVKNTTRRFDAPDNKPAETQKLQDLKNQFEVVIPKRIDSVTRLYTNKTLQLPKAKEPLRPAQATKGRPTFKLDGSYSEFPELAAFDNVVFEVGPENNNYTPELHEITWSDIKISQGPVKGKNYILTLSYRNRAEKLVVYPVLSGNDFTKAQGIYENKLSQYQSLVEKRNADEQKLMNELKAKQSAYLAEQQKKRGEYENERIKLVARNEMERQKELSASFSAMNNSNKAISLFNVARFGIYNSDCAHPVSEGRSVTPVFVIENGSGFIRPDFIYVIEHQTRSVLSLNANDAFAINYVPGSDYTICVFRQNKIYLCSKSDFQKTIASGSNKFPVKLPPGDPDDLGDFKKALEI